MQRNRICSEVSSSWPSQSSRIFFALFAILNLKPSLLEGMVVIDYRKPFRWDFPSSMKSPHTSFSQRRFNAWNLQARKRKMPSPIEEDVAEDDAFSEMTSDSSFISSPMDSSEWTLKDIEPQSLNKGRSLCRGRSAKQSNLYQELSSYHSTFLSLLTTEYRAEVCHEKIHVPSHRYFHPFRLLIFNWFAP